MPEPAIRGKLGLVGLLAAVLAGGLGLWFAFSHPEAAGPATGESGSRPPAGAIGSGSDPHPSPASRRILSELTVEENPEAATAPALTVQVVDEQGAPREGVPVALMIGGSMEMRRLTSGPAGLAEFAPLSPALRGATRFEAVLAFPQRETAPAALDPKHLPREPVRLLLPPCGRVAVRLADPDGAAIQEPFTLELGGFTQKEGSLAEPAGIQVFATAREGEALFPLVGLGVAVAASTWGSQAWEGSSVRSRGPERAGETARLDLILRKREATVLVGRVLSPGGEPLADKELPVFWRDAEAIPWEFAGGREGPEGPRTIRTDGVGRFRCALKLNPQIQGRWILTLSVGPSPGGNPEATAKEVELLFPLPGVEVPLGDVQLALAPLVAAGLVRDEEGRPVAEAGIAIESYMRIGKGCEVAFSSGGFFREGDWFWHPEAFLGAVSDLAGHFQILGYCGPEKIRLQAEKAGYVPDERRVAAKGATGVELRLLRPRSLAGSVLLSPGIPPQVLHIELVPALQGCDPMWARPEADGSFALSRVPPGKATLRVFLQKEGEPLLVLAGLEPGEAVPHPRLQGLDLRGRIHPFHLAVQGQQGEPLPRARVYLLAEESEAGGACLRIADQGGTDQEGRAVLYASRTTMVLEAHAAGRRSARLAAAPGRNVVALHAGIPVRLILQKKVQLPSPPLYLFARLAWLDEQGRENDRWYQAFAGAGDGCIDPEGRTRLILPGPGRFEVRWGFLECRSPMGATYTGTGADPARPVIEVLDLGEEQSFPVDLGVDPGAWKAVLKRRELGR